MIQCPPAKKANHTVTFFRCIGVSTMALSIFISPYSAIQLIDAAIEMKIGFVAEENEIRGKFVIHFKWSADLLLTAVLFEFSTHITTNFTSILCAK